jgi:hypothetical protein
MATQKPANHKKAKNYQLTYFEKKVCWDVGSKRLRWFGYVSRMPEDWLPYYFKAPIYQASLGKGKKPGKLGDTVNQGTP